MLPIPACMLLFVLLVHAWAKVLTKDAADDATAITIIFTGLDGKIQGRDGNSYLVLLGD